MIYFADFVDDRGLKYLKICKVLDCITDMADNMNINPYHASIMLDGIYRGIDITYRTYMESGEITITRSEGGYVVYSNDGTEIYEEEPELRKTAEKYVFELTVSVTGAREGEVLTGVRKNLSEGAVIRIAGGIAPPSKNDLDIIRRFPDMWNRFLDRLSSLDFYSGLTLTQRAMWLSDYERAGEYDIVDPPIADVEETYMQIFDVGKSTMLTIDGDELNELLAGNDMRIDGAWKGSTIRDKFPKKPGSNARRHTLIFYAHFWKVSASYKESTEFDGPVYDRVTKEFIYVERGVKVFVLDGIAASYIKKKKKEKKGRLYEVSSKQSIGILDLSNSNRNVPKYFDVLIDMGETRKNIDTIIRGCENFTAGTYKSLMQKIVRYAPQEVCLSINGKDISIKTQTMIRVVFTLLLTHPGGFLPDIKRFVSGQESALKRLVVTILEDSYHPETKDLLHLATLALLAQRVVGWKLCKEDYIFAIGVCDACVKERKTYKHGIKAGSSMEPCILGVYEDGDESTLTNVSALLDEIKSFEGDEAMTRYIASTGGEFIKEDNKIVRPRSMHLAHCIDQHSAPEIAFLLPVRIVERFRDPSYGSEPYLGLFKSIFRDVTGINSRRDTTGLSGHIPTRDKEFREAVEKAQKLVLLAKQHTQIPYENTFGEGEKYRISWNIDKSWIAGLVGPLNVPGKPAVMVTMKPDDPYQMVAIRKPARGITSKNALLDDERIEEAITSAREILSVRGAQLNAARPPVEWLSRYILKLDSSEGIEGTEKFVFFDPSHPRDLYEWEDIEHIEEDVDVYIPPWEVPELEDMLTYGGSDGIVLEAETKLGNILASYNVTTIRRALSYISSNRAKIEIARISKSGGGTAQAVILEDVGACQILLAISALYPKALQREYGYVSKFEVMYAPLLVEIKTVLRKKISGPVNQRNKISNVAWGDIKDTSDRKLRSYQNDTVEEMINKREQGKKGHFIWIPGGMGKTMIVLTYIKNLIDAGKAPKYVLYTLPSSAIKSIFTELEYFGFKINYVRPIKAWKKAPFTTTETNEGEPGYTISHNIALEGYINVIEHDDLRKVYDELLSKANNMIFIIDEVHKSLNDSKRTDVSLSISRLSIDFVAMTGTPIVDTNTYKLIWWLEQIVEFEVNDKNFWVAANGMIAKKVNTGIIVNKKDVIAEMNTLELKKYTSLIPKAMGGTNSRPSDKDIREAFEVSYQACDREMVKLTKLFLKTGVMMVTRSVAHQEVMKKMLIKAGIKGESIYAMGSGESIFMTDESVIAGDIPDYKVVIVTKRQAEGYTLTRMRTFITSVYPSNNATREQLELRINRISQHAKEINYRTVHSGILTYVLQRHKDAASISAVLSAIAKEI